MKISYCLAALVSAAALQTASAGGKIEALAGEVNGRIVALDSLGTLWAIRADARSFRDAEPIGELAGHSPVDLTLVSARGVDYAAVTGTMPSSRKVPGVLYLFNLTRRGKPQVFVLGQGLFTGLAYDPMRNRLLVAEAREPAVFEAGPIPSPAPQVRNFRSVPTLKTIGPVALDSVAKRLYCGDPVGGVIYAIDLESGRYSLVAEQVGEIRALCLDPRRSRLYVADSARRRVWAVRLNPPARVEPFAAGIRIQEPFGLATDAQGNLWIADAALGGIHIVSPNGQLLRRLTR